MEAKPTAKAWCKSCAAFQPADNAACERCGALMREARPATKRHLLRNFILIVLAPFVLLFGCYGVHEVLLTPEERAKEQSEVEARQVAEKAKIEADAKSAVDATAAASTPAPENPENARIFGLVSSAAAGAESLKESMRNPDSFKLSSAFFMPSNAICYQYRAQNGFGGMNVGNAVLTPKGALWNDDASWSRYCAGRKGRDMTWDVNYAAGWASLW